MYILLPVNKESNLHYYGCYCDLFAISQEITVSIQKEKMQLTMLSEDLKNLLGKAKLDENRLSWNFDLGEQRNKVSLLLREQGERLDRSTDATHALWRIALRCMERKDH